MSFEGEVRSQETEEKGSEHRHPEPAGWERRDPPSRDQRLLLTAYCRLPTSWLPDFFSLWINSRQNFDHRASFGGAECQRKEQAHHESSHVAPPSHPATGGGLNRQHLVARNELDQEPVAKQQDGGELDRPKEEDQGDESRNAGSWKADKVGAKHSCDSSARSDGGQAGPRVEDDVKNCPRQT